jgi:hypothetical protein
MNYLRQSNCLPPGGGRANLFFVSGGGFLCVVDLGFWVLVVTSVFVKLVFGLLVILGLLAGSAIFSGAGAVVVGGRGLIILSDCLSNPPSHLLPSALTSISISVFTLMWPIGRFSSARNSKSFVTLSRGITNHGADTRNFMLIRVVVC